MHENYTNSQHLTQELSIRIIFIADATNSSRILITESFFALITTVLSNAITLAHFTTSSRCDKYFYRIENSSEWCNDHSRQGNFFSLQVRYSCQKISQFSVIFKKGY